MKKQSGFTLIELLLVLAIIGIISAIAIPALLGQRDRARDKSASQNCVGIVADLIAQYDKAKEAGTAVDSVANFQANIIGTDAATSKVPTVWQSKNPWATTGATEGYDTTVITETATVGTATKAGATATAQGQVKMGYLPAGVATPGLIVTAVYLKNQFKEADGTTNTNVLLKISNIE